MSMQSGITDNNQGMSRRGFLKASATGTAALWIGVNSNGVFAATARDPAMGAGNLNPFVRIGDDGTVTVISKHFEMGQGPTTGLATLVAEELDVGWDTIKVEYAPSNNDLYKNFGLGSQGTGGSTAIGNSYIQYRQAGAAARDMLIRAAAQLWQMDAADVSLDDGMLVAGDKSANLSEVLEIAKTLDAPAEPKLKSPADFKYIGNADLHRKDHADKTNGTAMFSMDVKVPNMLYVTILRSPKFGGVLKSFNADAATGVNGYVDAKALPNNAGVAVYANSTWSAIKARRVITAEWDDAAAEHRSTDQMISDYQKLLDAEPVYDATGKENLADVEAEASSAPQTVEAEFIFPLLAHAPMEPLNCVLEPTGDGGVLLHDGCQFPSITHPTLAAILQLPAEKVAIKTYYAGGSFGRRANPTSDYHAEAAFAYALMGGQKAIKLVWTREDDLAGGYYRPMFAHRAKIGIDNGKIKAWGHRTVAQSIVKGTMLEQMLVHNGVDHFSVEGVYDTPYRIANMAVGLSDAETPMKVLWWRSVGHSQSGYVMETLMDMAAEAADADPVAFRLAHLDESDPDQARFAGVLKLAAEKAGWNGSRPAEGKGRGVAVHKSFNSYVAQIADVSVNEDGDISVDKFICAVDCGVVVNPDIVKAQMEGGIGYGIGHVMRNQITMTDGVVDQQNFPQYSPLRISDMPDIEVHMVASAADPTGIGEPGLPPAGPALGNAIYAATGKRVTRLPLDQNGISFA